MSQVVDEYDTKLDPGKRITIRGAKANFYHVTEREDGTIELTPIELIHREEISEKTLHMIDKAVDKFKKGRVSEPVDPDELEKLID